LLSLKVGEINFGQLPIFYRVNGRDLNIKELMGHKTLSVMANYAHGTPESMRGAVNQLRGTLARVVEFRAAS